MGRPKVEVVASEARASYRGRDAYSHFSSGRGTGRTRPAVEHIFYHPAAVERADERCQTRPSGQVDTVMQETRLFPPPADFARQARIPSLAAYEKLWREAADDLEGFWGRAAERIALVPALAKRARIGTSPLPSGSSAARPTPRTTASTGTWARRLQDKLALVWEGEPGDTRQLTYAELHREVCKFANVLKSLGIATGDVVSIYMPMVPELVIAMLACARIGAVHSVIFGGFSSEAIADRNNDAQAKLQITADYGWRRGQQLPLKKNVDEALAKSPTRQKLHRPAAHRRTGRNAARAATSGGTRRWPPSSADCPAEPLDSETHAVHPLHQRLDRQTQGDPPHHGRLQPVRQENVRVGVRSSRRATSSGARPTAAGSPATPTSSTARWPPAPRW